MFGFGDAKENYDQLNEGRHEAKFSHELLAGGASFAAFKAFEDHQRKEGTSLTPQSSPHWDGGEPLSSLPRRRIS
ncbi:hypothetical protein NLG97_g10733 [Lecanicillium saksenae]|uniref:Uncharacterized protein n=1 Tax=Lecanicillium saksenae TaxID=468837 RepID=A0ACC1QF28_9HYPO|nr:hypothetical protein NLG97_g10733 [Lecanicillium saksenae]